LNCNKTNEYWREKPNGRNKRINITKLIFMNKFNKKYIILLINTYFKMLEKSKNNEREVTNQ